MSDMTDERVRESVAWIKGLTIIPEESEVRPACLSHVTPSEYRRRAEDTLDMLARKVLALRERVKQQDTLLESRWRTIEGQLARVATLTRQRDGLEAVAREAVDGASGAWARNRDFSDLRARLAAITEPKGSDDATTA